MDVHVSECDVHVMDVHVSQKCFVAGTELRRCLFQGRLEEDSSGADVAIVARGCSLCRSHPVMATAALARLSHCLHLT